METPVQGHESTSMGWNLQKDDGWWEDSDFRRII